MRKIWFGLAFALVSTAQIKPPEIRVGDETVPAGQMVQLKISLTDPHPISTGKIGTKKLLDAAFFVDVEGISLFSGLDDVAGAAVIQTDGTVSTSFVVDPRFTSQTAPTFGMNPDYPILTMVVGTQANLPAGAQRVVDLDMTQSAISDLLGLNYAGATSKPGTITIGGTLSVNNVVPGGGATLPAGTVIRVLGTGFTSSTQIQMEDPKPSVRFVSDKEIDLTFSTPVDMQGKEIIVNNKNTKESVTYFSYLRATPLGSSTRALLRQTVPIFSKALPGGFLPTASSGSYTALALQNSTLATVPVTLALVSTSGQTLASATVQLGSGQRYVREVSELWAAGTVIPAGSSVRITPQTPIQMLGLAADDNAKSVTPLNISSTTPLPPLTASVQSLSFSYQRGGSPPASQSVALSTSGAPASFTVSQSPAASWLTVTPSTGTTPASLTVTAAPAGLAAGTYSTTIQVTPASGAATSIPVSLVVTDTTTPVITAVVNAANQQVGPISPGQIVTIYGNFPSTAPTGLALDASGNVATSLAKARVLFDGFPAPLTYVSATQINAVVPYEIADSGSTRITAEINGILSSAFTRPINASAPAIFTADSSGSGAAAALNQDFSFNTTTPAARGSVVILYATGEGRTSPPAATGSVTAALRSPQLNVTATIGGQPAVVEYAGAAPGLVAGVFQVNLRIPNNAPTGAAPVTITVGSAATQAGVTVSIQ